jgi:hypothetical protein
MGVPDATVGPGMNDWTAWVSWFRSLNWFGWLTWLDQHSGAVTALVTTIYAIFTVLLWQATKRQATLTQRTFEASNRPYLSMRLEEDAVGSFSVLSFTVEIVNVGSVPAEITKWEVSASLMDLDGKQNPLEQFEGQKLLEILRGACLFPHEENPVTIEFHQQDIVRTSLPLRMTVSVEYRGATETIYGSDLHVQRTVSEIRQRTTAT